MMKGKHSRELPAILGYHTEGELIHRGNLALLLPGTAGSSTICAVLSCYKTIGKLNFGWLCGLKDIWPVHANSSISITAGTAALQRYMGHSCSSITRAILLHMGNMCGGLSHTAHQAW